MKIAVYGSLKKGKYNHPILDDQKFLGHTAVSGTLYLVSTYPALLDEGSTIYPAEMYEVDDEVYSMIRGMELGAGYIEKEVVCTDIETGEQHTCIVYYAGESLAKRLKASNNEIPFY